MRPLSIEEGLLAFVILAALTVVIYLLSPATGDDEFFGDQVDRDDERRDR